MRKATEEDLLARVGAASTRADARDRSEPSGPRRVSDAPVAEPWRDALLRLSLELPIDLGLEETTRLFLDRLSAVLPNLALGACVVGENDQEPFVVVRVPHAFEPLRGHDPARLFPGLSDEHVLMLDDGRRGSTLHFACPRPAGTLTPFHLQVAERAALVLGAALARVRLYEEKKGGGQSVLELRAQLVQAEKLASLGQIVAGVVHELNNPLTSILAYSHYLTRRLDSGAALDGDDTERLRRISEAAERVLKFSRDLVTYARPTLEAPSTVHLDEIVDKALVFCEHEFSRNGVEVQKLYAPNVPKLVGVAGQLIQVFVNLFINAVHAMSETGGALRIAATPGSDDRTLLVEVIDTGTGISPEHLPQVFEPFFTTKADGRGTGLGLSIVRDIIDAHGGTVGVQSVRGAGTTFRITLPLAVVR